MDPSYGQTSGGGGAGIIGIIILVVQLAISILFIVSFWKVFSKAGKPGWACLVPFYSGFVMVQIAGKSILWFFLMFVPMINFIIWILLCVAIAEKFGKGIGMAILLMMGIGFIPLGFGSAEYSGGGGGSPAPAPA